MLESTQSGGLAADTDWRDDLVAWFRAAARDLPWREPGTSPWGILVSEVMSQQTPVARVAPSWRRWMGLWPEPADLAAAPADEVLREWGKLGYPRRALRLRECAAAIVAKHDGRVPADVEALLALPGIGDYTARAVAAFAFGARTPVVDVNVRRVLRRHRQATFLPGPHKRADMDAVEGLLYDDPAAAAELSAAWMELGATVCKTRPACVPGAGVVRVGGRGVAGTVGGGVGGGEKEGAEVRGHRPSGAGEAAGRAARRRVAGGAGVARCGVAR